MAVTAQSDGAEGMSRRRRVAGWRNRVTRWRNASAVTAKGEPGVP